MSDPSSSLAAYLRARRAQLKPEDVGYPPDPGRRVRGLRRAEVAERAGISLEYYVRIEQGRPHQLSEQVLAGLVSALRLDAHAAAFLYRLALPAPPVGPPGARPAVSDVVVDLIEQWSDLPAYVFDRNQDVLVVNDLTRAILPTVARPGSNLVECVFQVPHAGRGLAGWRGAAERSVAALRYHGHPEDPRLHELIGALSVRDEDFRRMWADFDARPLTSGTVPVVVEGEGLVAVPWQVLGIPDGLFLAVLAAPAGAPDIRRAITRQPSMPLERTRS